MLIKIIFPWSFRSHKSQNYFLLTIIPSHTIIKVNSFHGFGNEILFFPFDKVNSILKTDTQRYHCMIYIDSQSLVVRASWEFSNRVVFCWKTLFQGWNMLLLEVPFSPACPSRTQPFAVPMGLWWEKASSRGAVGSQASWW